MNVRWFVWFMAVKVEAVQRVAGVSPVIATASRNDMLLFAKLLAF